ncbi:MFS transporter [Millisia brevis]|uniref:MFS transporter n=1 Tax=Millisia brevis TaxID=264148 RepID=UPI000A025204|nr:MFS transporter [Millisia brevis]
MPKPSTIDNAAPTDPGQRGGAPWGALAALCFAVLVVMIDNTIVNVALPTISRDLGAGTSGLQWVVDSYTLVFAGLLLAGGHLGDRFGRRGVLLLGLAGFAAVSIPAALSTSLVQLIAARAGLGVFAALVFPATLAIITTIFTTPTARATAVGIWAATSGIAVAIGPVLGGWLLEHFSWSAVFWVNLPIAAAAMVAIVVAVPRVPVEHDAGRLDVVGALLSIAGLALLTYSVIEGPHHGWTSAATILGLSGAAALLALLVVWELRIPAPIIDMRLFANGRFSAAAGIVSLAFFALFGFIFLITQYFQAVQGYSPLEAGVRTLPFAIVMAVVSPIAMLAAKTVGHGRVTAVGAVIMGTGFLLVQRTEIDSSYWGLVVWSMCLMAMGLACISGPATEIIMNALRPDQAGAGSAVNDTTREIGGTLGVAALGSILTSAYGPRLADALAGTPLPEEARAAAQTSVMAGVEVARSVPAPLGDQVLLVVQQSFVTGLHHASWLAVAACWIAAPIVWVMLRTKSHP